MFHKQLMISGLRKQQSLLSELVRDVENNAGSESPDLEYYGKRTAHIADNLRRLREIQKEYFNFLCEPSNIHP